MSKARHARGRLRHLQGVQDQRLLSQDISGETGRDARSVLEPALRILELDHLFGVALIAVVEKRVGCGEQDGDIHIDTVQLATARVGLGDQTLDGLRMTAQFG